MAVSFRYWDDCVEPEDLEAMWRDPEVSKEWIDAGENKGQKVHLSRDPDGQPYLTQTEMKTVAMIIVSRHFSSLVDPDMICAIATLESDRQLLTMRYNKKIKDTTVGIMQLLPKTAEWLVSDMGYRTYEINGEPELLYRPFISVYFGAAYLQWLSNHDGKERNEEYVVRAYRAGPKKATHKSTLDCWQRYLSVKQSLPSRRQMFENHPPDLDASPSEHVAQKTGDAGKYWDSRASPEDMDELWKNAGILKEWIKTGERRGKVRFSRDESDKPYLSRLEVKAVAGIIISKHFNGSGIKPVSTYSTVKNHRPLGLQNQSLSALAEISSMRFLDGAGSCTGIMGLDYEKACWLYKELGYTAYKVKSIEDLSNPFISMYFAAAYMVWLSKYEGRERSQQFVIQAYLNGPEKVNLQETGPLWLKFEEALSHYDEQKTREHKRSSCSIL